MHEQTASNKIPKKGPPSNSSNGDGNGNAGGWANKSNGPKTGSVAAPVIVKAMTVDARNPLDQPTTNEQAHTPSSLFLAPRSSSDVLIEHLHRTRRKNRKINFKEVCLAEICLDHVAIHLNVRTRLGSP
jgi:hypothetical protein